MHEKTNTKTQNVVQGMHN